MTKLRNVIDEIDVEDKKILGYNFDNCSLNAKLLSRENGKVYSLHP